ncbi:MAG: tetratricopeptide repeat protein [Bryobacterales bacterium]|nr:tetratricopeptide repeat protein [Bryobacteraceae bacterium]MDW8130181.1 tetratricopeptide repeat protein [Bryobacterales bacterium]
MRKAWVLGAAIALGLVSCSRDPEVVKRRYLESGNRYFEKKQYKEASIMYRQALRKDPRYGEAYYRLGLTQLRLNRIPEAVRWLRRAVELLPDRTEPKVELGEIYLRGLATTAATNTKQIEYLRSEIQQLAEQLPPSSAQRHRLLGYYYLSARKLKEALAEFRRAHDAGPFQPEFTLPLIEVLFEDGQAEEAEKLARELLRKRPELPPAYDVLYLHYVRSKREGDAEAVLKQKVASLPKVAGAWLQLAAHYHRQQRSKEMQAALDHLISHPGDFPEAYQLVGDFFRVRGDFENALRYYDLGAQKDGARRARYQKARAQVLLEQGRRAEAASLVEEIIKQNPKDEEARAMRAALIIEGGSPDELRTAVADLQAAVGRTPDNPVLRFQLGRALARQGQWELARVQFEEAIKRRPNYLPPRFALAQYHMGRRDFASALTVARQVLELDPGNLPAKLLRHAALVAMGNTAQARKDLETVIREHPGSREALLALASLNLAESRYAEAEEQFRKLHQNAEPADLRALVGWSETYAAQGRFAQAVEVLKKELERDPSRQLVRAALANMLVRAGRFDEAIAEYNALIAKHPSAGDLYLRLGEAQRRKGDTQAAAASFAKAVELMPKEPAALLALALIQDQLQQFAQSQQTYERILALQPDHPVALNNLAYLLAERGGDLDRALMLAQRARQKLPHDNNVADTLGWIYIRKNLADQAIEIFRELTRKEPNNPTFHYHYGMALYQKGDRPGARQALQTALRNKPSPEEAARIRELLGKLG